MVQGRGRLVLGRERRGVGRDGAGWGGGGEVVCLGEGEYPGRACRCSLATRRALTAQARPEPASQTARWASSPGRSASTQALPLASPLALPLASPG